MTKAPRPAASERRGAGSPPVSRLRRTLRWLRRIVVVAALVVAAGVGLWMLQLDRVITSTFEGRRWSVPARVFALPLELYAGRALSADQLVLELDRVGYRAGSAREPGRYVRDGDRVDVHLRSFAFADGTRRAVRVRVHFEADRVDRIQRIDDRARVDLVRVEPPVIGSIFPSHGEDRLIVEPGDAPLLLLEALKAVEDRNFDKHHGFDPKAIVRAALVNLRAGSVEQGGSTLTQQLVKNYFLDGRRTLERKLRELAMAVILELRFEKADLLNAYVNEVYVGQDGARAVHGFGLASQFYFGKPLGDVTPAETALLVALIRGPSYYNPFRHPERARARRDLVLRRMAEADLVTDVELETALAAPLGVERRARRAGRYYPAFMDLVRTQLRRDYDPVQLASNGFRIFTTLDPVVQESAERALQETLGATEAARGIEVGSLQGAVVVVHAQTGEVQAVVGSRDVGGAGFNYAVDGRRPIGSLVKPLVYLSALEADPSLHLASVVDDAPVRLREPNGAVWAPSNFSGGPRGAVPLYRALAESLNLATVAVGMSAGVEVVAERIGSIVGIDAPAPYPSLLLGAMDLSPVQVARLYAVFAGGGFAAPQKTILAVEDRAGGKLDRFPLEMGQRADPATVLAIDHALGVVMRRGTGRGSRFAERGVAGKTGTSDEFRDAWFAGFDAAHLAVVWVG
ncbi:MAG: transglycosylase domain-containing protein, partial [Pseudomonadales bacterium]|nr:transglycosylase domain-containing protein [Pseudomonadales bacterium]